MIGAPTLILCYHRINEGVDDPFHLCVSPANFSDHLAVLQRKAEIITLDEVCKPSRKPRVAVTFDDGYADNLVYAAPIAQRYGVPITVYVSSGLVGDPRGFWWDRLARLVLHGAPGRVDLPVTIGGVDVPARFGVPETAHRMLMALRDRLRLRPVHEIDAVLDRLGRQLSVDPVAAQDARSVSAAELQRLHGFDGVTIGAHSVDHVLLRLGSYPEQLQNVKASKSDLQGRLGALVQHFAYPYGDRYSFNHDSVFAARNAGFETATTTVPGSVGTSSTPFALRRRLVMNWSARRFQTQMLRWGML
jgi:peptidoglycan/xylan/chitin deacetylase (PgdA/CDA1 family)